MRTISAQSITDTVARLCIKANTQLPQDVQAALEKAREEEPWPLAKNTLDLLWSNLSAAKEKDLPICQDTGMACVFVELGTDVHIDGSFEAAIHEGVRRGYTDGYLRKSIVADTGLDVLTHAIEAYVSVMASDYTDGLALHAIEMVFTYLEKSYNGDPLAREKMHNASCIAGMAFTNAFLGLNHSMAHKLGAECHIPHGRANAILLPYVIKYNATKPTKFASFPKYKEYVADERYAKIARRVGLCSADTPISEAVDCLVKAIRELMTVTERPLCIKDCGVSEAEFMSKVDELSYKAFEDQCTTANPVYPLVSEIKELYREAYYGE